MPKNKRQKRAIKPVSPEMAADLQAIGRNVRLERKKLGQSLQDMAAGVGCSWQQLGHIERANFAPSWNLYWKLVRYLKAGKIPLTN